VDQEEEVSAEDEKIGKMSIMPMRDLDEEHSVEARKRRRSIANRRFGHSRRANKYIIGMHKTPNMQAAIRHRMC